MNIWKRYSMRVSKNWVKFNKMFTLSPWVVPPVLNGKTEKLSGRYTRWPTVNTLNGVQSRAILLLCKAFNWSPTFHQDQIDSILNEAWVALTQHAKLLISSS